MKTDQTFQSVRWAGVFGKRLLDGSRILSRRRRPLWRHGSMRSGLGGPHVAPRLLAPLTRLRRESRINSRFAWTRALAKPCRATITGSIPMLDCVADTILTRRFTPPSAARLEDSELALT